MPLLYWTAGCNKYSWIPLFSHNVVSVPAGVHLRIHLLAQMIIYEEQRNSWSAFAVMQANPKSCPSNPSGCVMPSASVLSVLSAQSSESRGVSVLCACLLHLRRSEPRFCGSTVNKWWWNQLKGYSQRGGIGFLLPFSIEKAIRDCIIEKRRDKYNTNLWMDYQHGRVNLMLLHLTALRPNAWTKRFRCVSAMTGLLYPWLGEVKAL